jgi:hypothetical protein
MASYNISIIPAPAQNFTVQLGQNTLSFKIQWQERFGYFRVDIGKQNGDLLTAGRIMNVGVDLLEDLYPSSTSNSYGSLKVSGEIPTPSNFGIDNKLVWSNV